MSKYTLQVYSLKCANTSYNYFICGNLKLFKIDIHLSSEDVDWPLQLNLMKIKLKNCRLRIPKVIG